MEKSNGITISVVSPLYKGEKMLDSLVGRNTTVLQQMIADELISDYEIILVNDASPDNSWAKLKEICSKDTHIVGINLSRNFGQPNAVTAGCSYVTGDWIVIMDCDLQDRPEEIPHLFAKAMEGWDVVLARRVNKQASFMKKLSSKLFHVLYDWLAGTKSDPSIGNFGIYCDKIIKEYVHIPEYVRTFSVLISSLGFKTTTIDVEHAEREEGHSSYTLSILLKLTYNIIISNSNKPLRMAVSLGFIMSAIAFLMAIYNVIAKFFGLIDVPGYTFTVFSIWFACGIQMSMMGILGLYLGKIFDQVKGRPSYIIRDIINPHMNK